VIFSRQNVTVKFTVSRRKLSKRWNNGEDRYRWVFSLLEIIPAKYTLTWTITVKQKYENYTRKFFILNLKRSNTCIKIFLSKSVYLK
jgi:hypothetical protein